MGMTLWIQTLEGREMSSESDDHSMMHELAEQLDAICDDSGVPKLTSFFDTTDLELNMAEDGEGEWEEPEDPETGYAYGIEDMKWFDAAVGLNVLQTLRARVESSPSLKLGTEEMSLLVEELDDCIERLKGPASRNGKFNLPVVM